MDWFTDPMRLEQDNINIEDLNLKIIPSYIRSDGNCFYDSIFAAIHNSTIRSPNADITIVYFTPLTFYSIMDNLGSIGNVTTL